MKRRDFITRGTAGAVGAGLAGCSAVKPRKINIEPALPPFSFGDNYPKQEIGTMPMTELGKTGIKISKFGFGSHMRPYLRPYEKEREGMIRAAFDYGVNVFDVYDKEHEVYQYEPTGRYLAPIKNDVVISIAINPYDGRTLDQELERDLRLFGRDYIDLCRIHIYTKENEKWAYWDKLFKYKEQGKIRAVGVPVHNVRELFPLIDTYPIDYVIFPYNFFMNIAWDGHMPDQDFEPLNKILRDKGIGIITMKPFAGDFLATPLMETAEIYNDDKDVNFIQACLRYIINSGMNPDSTFTGMYYPSHVHENVEAYYNPQMSPEEKKLLAKVAKVAKTSAHAWLPEHYKFFTEWTPGGLHPRALV
ncbi:aldo/keto reductase [Candidatus Latescibacterota bacterium]